MTGLRLFTYTATVAALVAVVFSIMAALVTGEGGWWASAVGWGASAATWGITRGALREMSRMQHTWPSGTHMGDPSLRKYPVSEGGCPECGLLAGRHTGYCSKSAMQTGDAPMFPMPQLDPDLREGIDE